MKLSKHHQQNAKFSVRADRLYFALNKPFAMLSQFSCEPNSDKDTLALLGFPAGVYPVGRLDYDSEGLLILTDDTRLNGTLLDPANAHWRTYLVQVERIPSAAALEQLSSGVVIEGRATLPTKVHLLADPPTLWERGVPIRFRKNVPTAWIELALKEGKNRQVRKMTASVGHPTLRLVRRAIGKLDLFELGLDPGQWKALEAAEIAKLFS